MRTKSFPLTLTIISSLVSGIAAASPQSVSIKMNPKIVAAYWTPERMREATSMELPQADRQAVIKLSLNEVMQQYKGDKQKTVLAASPTVQIAPQQHLLFTPRLQKIKSRFDAGISAEPFSSSQLTPLSADQSYPYTTVGKVFLTTPTGPKTCSGAVISTRIVLTAGHCIHNGNGSSTGWYSDWTFVPAFRNGNAPFNVWTASTATIAGSWYSSGGTVPNANDWGLLVMEDQTINGTVQSIGNVVGKLGFQTLSTMPNHANLMGYPGNLDSGQIMHQVTSQSALAVAPSNVEYGSDMNLGSGGGPWIQNFGAASAGETGGTNPGRNLVIGLSSYGYADTVTLAEGSPILTSAFSGLYNVVCGAASGNC